jgi:hypothetical protein
MAALWGPSYAKERTERAHLADPADVLVAGLLVKPEVFVQAEADVVPVQSVRKFVQMEQVLLESAGDRGLCVKKVREIVARCRGAALP